MQRSRRADFGLRLETKEGVAKDIAKTLLDLKERKLRPEIKRIQERVRENASMMKLWTSTGTIELNTHWYARDMDE